METTSLIRWRLKEVMARHSVKGKDLAKKLGVSENAVSSLRRPNMPRLDGDDLNNLCEALNDLSQFKTELVTPGLLIEYIPEAVIAGASK